MHRIKLKLEHFTFDDFQKLIDEVQSEEELALFAGNTLQFPLTNKILTHYLDDDLKIVLKAVVDGKTVGNADIYLENPAIPRLCRIIIYKEFRGMGFGKKLVRELVKYCVRNLKLKIIELNVLEGNTVAYKCYKKAGFFHNPANDKTFEANGKQLKTLSMIYFHSSLAKV